MPEKMEGKIVRMKLSDLIRDIIKNKSPIVEINGITIIFEDYIYLEEKDVKSIGTGFHVMVPKDLGVNFGTVYLVHGKRKEEFDKNIQFKRRIKKMSKV